MANILGQALDEQMEAFDQALQQHTVDVKGEFDEDLELYESLSGGDFERMAQEIGPDATANYVLAMEKKRRERDRKAKS